MSLISLRPHQTSHVQRMLKNLSSTNVTIDTSGTGAGKTFTSLFIAQTLGLPLSLISPKSISLVWESLCEQLNISVHSISSYALIAARRVTPWSEPVLVVCDEFHYLKNDTKRFQKVKKLLSILPEGSKVILLSATPYDKESNTTQMKELYKAIATEGCYTDVLSSMSYSIPYSLTITKGYFNVDADAHELYAQGVYKLHSLHRSRYTGRPINPRIVAGMITNGTRMIHDGTVQKLIEIARNRLTVTHQMKLVVIAKYTKNMDLIAEKLCEFGVVQLDGRTTNRLDIIQQFQAPNNTIRVIVTSAQVGGVGINLDDQHGSYPREMLILPSYECIDLVQCVGRIHRSSTKSPASVTLVLANKCTSPIISNVDRKLNMMNTLTDSVAHFVKMTTYTEE